MLTHPKTPPRIPRRIRFRSRKNRRGRSVPLRLPHCSATRFGHAFRTAKRRKRRVIHREKTNVFIKPSAGSGSAEAEKRLLKTNVRIAPRGTLSPLLTRPANIDRSPGQSITTSGGRRPKPACRNRMRTAFLSGTPYGHDRTGRIPQSRKRKKTTGTARAGKMPHGLFRSYRSANRSGRRPGYFLLKVFIVRSGPAVANDSTASPNIFSRSGMAARSSAVHSPNT